MTGSEAFVETLVSHDVTDVFGIVGSAFMDALDLFPEAGIRFIPTQHEQNAVHMADGYSRISGKHGVCVAQNGPGITNFVTGIAAAYWAHSPVVAITPECGSNGKGLGGFQECDQIPIFSGITKYQGNIVNSSRIAEITSRAFDYALFERGPTQINIPRDLFYSEHEFTIPKPRDIEHPIGSVESIKNAINLLSECRSPCILAGGGVRMSNGINNVSELSSYLGAPVATTYLHNDSFPCNNDLSVGPLGYQGFESAMKCINESDVILAIGSRMNPFGTLQQYGFDYWPKKNKCKIIQIDIDHKRLGLTKDADVYINGDANACTKLILNGLKSMDNNKIKCLNNKQERLEVIIKHKKEWENKLNDWTYSVNTQYDSEGRIRPRQALRELEKALSNVNGIVSTDIGNICSVANSYLRFSEESEASFLAAMTFGNCQYAVGSVMGAKVANPNRFCVSYAGDGAFGMSFNELLTCERENIPITCVVFNNGQWGAEKKNQVLWFGDRYIGVNLNNNNNKNEYVSFTDIGKAMNLETIKCTHNDQIYDAMNIAIDNQLNKNKTTIIEIMCTKELGDPFRRDAMRLPKRYLNKYKHTIQTKESQTEQPIDI
eukprot:141533_1